MTDKKVKSGTIDMKVLLAGDEEFLRALVRTALQEVFEAEMTEALGAETRVIGRQTGRLSVRLLWPDADHADRQPRTARTAGPRRAVLHRAVVRKSC
jgi:hypothetical protein